MPSEKSSEKKTLLFLFIIFFTLSAILVYVMIKQDIVNDELWEKSKESMFQEKNGGSQAWPKVEIKARTN